MNLDMARRAGIGMLTAGTNAAHDIYFYADEENSPGRTRDMILASTAGTLGGTFAGQGISHLAALSGGRRRLMGDVLTFCTGLGGSILGAIAARKLYDHRNSPQLQLSQNVPV